MIGLDSVCWAPSGLLSSCSLSDKAKKSGVFIYEEKTKKVRCPTNRELKGYGQKMAPEAIASQFICSTASFSFRQWLKL
jgi:hypothetical protein